MTLDRSNSLQSSHLDLAAKCFYRIMKKIINEDDCYTESLSVTCVATCTISVFLSANRRTMPAYCARKTRNSKSQNSLLPGPGGDKTEETLHN